METNTKNFSNVGFSKIQDVQQVFSNDREIKVCERDV